MSKVLKMNKELILDFLTVVPKIWKKMIFLKKDDWLEKEWFEDFLKFYCKSPFITNEIMDVFKKRYEIYIWNWNYFEEVWWLEITEDFRYIFKLENLNLNWFVKVLNILKKAPFYCDEKYLFFDKNKLSTKELFLKNYYDIFDEIYFKIKNNNEK